MGVIESVNVGVERAILAKTGRSGIDKRPVAGAVSVDVPAPGCSGLPGDPVSDTENHGGPDQAVYAYAREDLEAWVPTLGPLRAGTFGENLTTRELDVTGARIGERWHVGDSLVLQVTGPRIPCRTFAAWLDRAGWVREFTTAGVPGAYLRVVEPGPVRAGDRVVVERPDHQVTIGLAFRALMTAPELLPELLPALSSLPADVRERLLRRLPAR
ncbi:MOSC domain-containing protein [Actinomycetospora corticicola]|uniref:MOSC domain-containing protein YiiM n=1 Tax=Actinomycetospora corticicola TaxID=663602 RepID=A0A7Y9DU63_9PSEU|nr:MOSC domain-containing protein YiiM [Actinomycetospora corticicola]